MDPDQANAIESQIASLIQIWDSSAFTAYLNSRKDCLTDDESQLVNFDDDKVEKIFIIVKWKDGSWALVAKYLNDDNCLVTKLLLEAKIETTKSESSTVTQSTDSVRDIKSAPLATDCNAVLIQMSNSPSSPTTSPIAPSQVPDGTIMATSLSDPSTDTDKAHQAMDNQNQLVDEQSSTCGVTAKPTVNADTVAESSPSETVSDQYVYDDQTNPSLQKTIPLTEKHSASADSDETTVALSNVVERPPVEIETAESADAVTKEECFVDSRDAEHVSIHPLTTAATDSNGYLAATTNNEVLNETCSQQSSPPERNNFEPQRAKTVVVTENLIDQASALVVTAGGIFQPLTVLECHQDEPANVKSAEPVAGETNNSVIFSEGVDTGYNQPIEKVETAAEEKQNVAGVQTIVEDKDGTAPLSTVQLDSADAVTSRTASRKCPIPLPRVPILVEDIPHQANNTDEPSNLKHEDKIRMFEKRSQVPGCNAKPLPKPRAIKSFKCSPEPTEAIAIMTVRSGNDDFVPMENPSGTEVVQTATVPIEKIQSQEANDSKESTDQNQNLLIEEKPSECVITVETTVVPKTLVDGLSDAVEVVKTTDLVAEKLHSSESESEIKGSNQTNDEVELTADNNPDWIDTILGKIQRIIGDDMIIDYTKVKSCADPMDKFTKTVEIILKILSNPEMTTQTKSSTMWLLIEIVRESDENRKNLVGRMDGVKRICEVIDKQLTKTHYDEILFDSWHCIWSLVDTTYNSERFLGAGGMPLFELSYAKFGAEQELVDVMMKTMWRLSTFPSIRPQLMNEWYLEVFWEIFRKFDNNMNISYRCVNTFDNFLSYSPSIPWPLDSPTVEETKNLLIETINKWQLDVNINISWTSFLSYLNELKLHKSPLTDLLDIWRFANGTTVDAPKYCRMLRDEGGMEILTTEVIQNSNSSSDAIRLATVAVENTNRWQNKSD